MSRPDADISGLARLAEHMLGPGIAAGHARPEAGDPAHLMPQERAGVADMVPKRQREYAAGRAAVRMAALAGGAAPFAVPTGADRAPVWPAGVIGSISHTIDACLAVVGREGRLASVGIDLERDEPLPSSITDGIVCDADRAAGRTARQLLGERYGLAVFCAKEAAYKCQYQLTGGFMDFDALSIRLSPDDGTFVAAFERRVGAFDAGTTLDGRFAFCAGHVLTAAWITREQWSTLAAPAMEVAHA